MGSIFILVLMVVLSITGSSAAKVYTVGGSSGWDISTDLDSWLSRNTFSVGDTLLFQYSQYHSVCEVTRQNYETCNTTNVLQSSTGGNTTFVLTGPGERLFVCGNRLHCLGGMKIRVNVESNETGISPLPQPQSGGNLPPAPTSSHLHDPTSSSFLIPVGFEQLVLAFFCSLSILI